MFLCGELFDFRRGMSFLIHAKFFTILSLSFVLVFPSFSHAQANEDIDSVLRSAFSDSFKAKELKQQLKLAEVNYNSESDYGYTKDDQNGFRNRYNLSMRVPVYDFGKRGNKVEAERLKMQSARYACEANMMDLADKIIEEMHNLLKSKINQHYLNSRLKISEQKGIDLSRLYEAGKKSREQVINVLRDTAFYESELILSEQKIKESDLELELLTGINDLSENLELPEYHIVDLSEYQPESDELPGVKYYKSVALSKERMAASANRNWAPNIGFEMYYTSYDLDDSENTSQLEKKDETFAGISISIPLFDRGQSSNDKQKYMQEKYGSNLSKAKHIEQMRIMHEKYIRKLKLLPEVISAKVKIAELSKENTENQKRLYKEGLIKKEEMLSGEEEYLASLKEVSVYKLEYVMTLKKLEIMTGEFYAYCK
jgi:outer membrane protein TolC